MVNNFIVEGMVYHERLKPFNHRFIYNVFLLKFPLDEIEELKSPLFSFNSFNLFSFYFKDYLDGSERPLKEKIKEVLNAEGIKAEGKIVLQTMPRILGYGFNPVSFWYVYDQEDKLEAILSEVNNTFGDRHYYLLQGFSEYKKITMQKVFHVSPFFDIEGEYQFSFNPKTVVINYFDPKSEDYFFKSTLSVVKTHEFSTRNLLKMFFKYPMMTFVVMGRIHWQAVKLFFKKAKFFSHPTPPEKILSKEVQS